MIPNLPSFGENKRTPLPLTFLGLAPANSGLLNKSRIRADQGLSPFKSSFKAQKWGKIEQNPCTSLKATQENVSKVTKDAEESECKLCEGEEKYSDEDEVKKKRKIEEN